MPSVSDAVALHHAPSRYVTLCHAREILGEVLGGLKRRRRDSLIWQLEASKKMLSIEEAGRLNARPKLLEDLAAMEADSAGWFS